MNQKRLTTAASLFAIVFSTGVLAFTLPAPRSITPRDKIDMPLTERWVDDVELTSSNAALENFQISSSSHAAAADFRITVKAPAAAGALTEGWLEISDGKAQTNICSISFSWDGTNEVDFQTFSVTRECLQSSRFQV